MFEIFVTLLIKMLLRHSNRSSYLGQPKKKVWSNDTGKIFEKNVDIRYKASLRFLRADIDLQG